MTAGKINERVVAERVLWIRQMIEAIRDLPTGEKKEFLRNRHNVAAAESYLRRALEALFDFGRHILAKRFGYPATEYKEIADRLLEKKVMTEQQATIMRKMAGYRNRMVHFYHEITPEELWDICSNHLADIEFLTDALRGWVSKNSQS